MKIQKIVLFFFLLILSSASFAEIIVQNGRTYSCELIEDRDDRPRPTPHRDCTETCVRYCSRYDSYPFTSRCLQYADQCGINPSVTTMCAQYDAYPFQSRCLLYEDNVSTSRSCH